MLRSKFMQRGEYIEMYKTLVQKVEGGTNKLKFSFCSETERINII